MPFRPRTKGMPLMIQNGPTVAKNAGIPDYSRDAKDVAKRTVDTARVGQIILQYRHILTIRYNPEKQSLSPVVTLYQSLPYSPLSHSSCSSLCSPPSYAHLPLDSRSRSFRNTSFPHSVYPTHLKLDHFIRRSVIPPTPTMMLYSNHTSTHWSTRHRVGLSITQYTSMG